MRKALFLALALLLLPAFAEEDAPWYTWKAMGGGLVYKDLPEATQDAAVFLYDANKCSQSNLIVQAKAGVQMAKTTFVIGNVVHDGNIPTSGTFQYSGEPAGTEWAAYFALRVARSDGSEYLYISSPVTVMGTALDETQIAFEEQSAWANVYHDADDYEGPGWYAVTPAANRALAPADGQMEREIVATSEEDALGKVAILGPGEAIVPSADYAKYFKLTATPKSEGIYLVRAELDKEAIELDKTVSAFAAKLAEIAAAGTTTVTVTIDGKSGLYYRILVSSAVNGTFAPAEGDKGVQATGGKASVPVTPPSGESSFFKVEVSAEKAK